MFQQVNGAPDRDRPRAGSGLGGGAYTPGPAGPVMRALLLVLPLALAACASVAPSSRSAEAWSALLADRAAPPDSAEAAYLARLLDGPDRQRLVAQAWPVVPDSARAALGALGADVGAGLVAWWQAQDPLPSTPRNERLAEHLRRVSRAERDYADGSPDGYDDRGLALVRFGEPDDVRSFTTRGLEAAGAAEAGEMAANALWTYEAEGAAYLFVEDGGWREGSPVDLLPTQFRVPRVGYRAQAWGMATVLTLRELLAPLALAVPEYGRIYDTADALAFGLSESALRAGVSPVRYATGFNSSERFGPAVDGSGMEVAAVSLSDDLRAKHRAAVQRRDALPASGVDLPAVAALPLALRAARFRAPDGGTRVALAWAPEPGAYVGLGAGLALRSTAVLSEASARGAVERRAARLTPVPAWARGPGATTPVETATLDGAARPTVAVEASVVTAAGAVVRRGVGRVPALEALAPSPGGLVVSDPLPHLVDPAAVGAIGGASRDEAEAARARWRYPYAVVAPGALIGVYVEAYDLGTERGAARYEVAREVWLVRPDGERLFMSGSATPSATGGTTAREFVLLPVPESAAPGDRVELIGTIRDLVTGRSGTWALTFGVAG